MKEAVEQDEQGRHLLMTYLEESNPGKGGWRKIKAKDYPTGQAILNADEAEQVSVLFATFHLPAAKHLFVKIFVVQPLIQDLFRRGIAFSEPDLLRLCQEVVTNGISDFDLSTMQWITRYLEKAAASQGLSERLRTGAALIQTFLRYGNMTADAHKLDAQIQTLLHGPAEDPLHTEDAWGAAILADWKAMPDPSQRGDWLALLTQTLAAEAAKPSAKWLKDARALLDTLGFQAAQAQIATWLEKYLTTPLPSPQPTGDGYGDYVEHQRLTTLSNENYQAVKGMVWLCRLFDDGPTARLLGDVAVHSLKKIPGHGPKSAKVGTACILSLGAMSGHNPIVQLSRLKTRVTYQAALGVLDKVFNEAASRSGLTHDDLEELAVPGFELEANGQRGEQFGEYQAAVTVTKTGSVKVMWTNAEGQILKYVPQSIKREHADALKSLKRSAAEMQEVLQTQRDRLENLMRSGHTWPLHLWRERYLAHPLLSLLSHRLIWRFGEQTGIARNGQIEDENGRLLKGLSEDTPVQLWHPLASNPNCIFSWRTYLEQLSITQPFKQAHREIYLLTEAERQTRLYSNRFAAHILKQHQFSALCKQRGWQYTLQGEWDSHNFPTLHSPLYGLSVSFAVDGIATETMQSASNIYLYVTTGAVTFSPLNGHHSLPLDQLPPLAFSEVMRDVDLFVGVASVGNDPAWSDGGPEGRFRDYWHGYAFGDLGETAKTRAEVLGRLLPRLKIAGRCRLDGRFLFVRGDLRTYKIHLGSGNILMEPNDQYLCIVPGRSEDSGDLFLPFEGDRMLAIILSKAFLLADDKAIKDPTIVSQIKRP